jgi:hypothetical protein
MNANRTNELHPVHRFIQALGRDPAVQQRFGADAGAVFAEFGLSNDEIAALKDGSIAALAKIGVNPILRMHWLMMSNPEAASHMSVTEYLPKFNAGASHG